MPIHDQSYRRYAGSRTPPGRAWTVIAWSGIKNMIKKRSFLGLLILSWVPFLGYAFQLYLSTNFRQIALFAPTAQMFRDFFWWQDFSVFFITIYAGAGLIADDRRANALQIYLSKPLMRSEYIGGKATVLFFFILLVTLVPALLLLLLQILLAGSFAFVSKNLFLFPAITAASLLVATVATLTMLALSSLSNSTRYVAILYTGLVFFTLAVGGVMTLITGSTRFMWMAMSANAAQVMDVIFRVPPRYATPWQVSMVVLVCLVALSISVLERRVRGVEVVT